MKQFTSIAFTALTLFLSAASAAYVRSEPFQPGGEFGEYEPFQLTLSEPFTKEVIHTEALSWQVVSYLSSEEGAEPHEISLSVEYYIPPGARNNSDSLRYLLTGGPGDRNRNLPTLCALMHDQGGATMLTPDRPISYRNTPIRSIFCMAMVMREEA